MVRKPRTEGTAVAAGETATITTTGQEASWLSGYSSVGRVPHLECGSRRFESCYPDQFTYEASSVGMTNPLWGSVELTTSYWPDALVAGNQR